MKVIDIIVSYCKNTIEYMIKNHDYSEMDYVNKFFNNINFILNQNTQDELFYFSDRSPSSIFKYFTRI